MIILLFQMRLLIVIRNGENRPSRFVLLPTRRVASSIVFVFFFFSIVFTALIYVIIRVLFFSSITLQCAICEWPGRRFVWMLSRWKKNRESKRRKGSYEYRMYDRHVGGDDEKFEIEVKWRHVSQTNGLHPRNSETRTKSTVVWNEIDSIFVYKK